MAMKGNAMLSGLIGLGVAAVILAIMAPLIQTAFVSPVTETFNLGQSVNMTAVNGTTVTIANGGFYNMLSATVANSTNTLPITDYTLVTGTSPTIAFKVAGAGKITTASEAYTITGVWTHSGYQSSAVNRTIAPFVLAMLFVAVIAMIAMAYL